MKKFLKNTATIVACFAVFAVCSASLTGCKKSSNDKTGFVKIVNNSSFRADGGIAESENTSKMEVFVGLSPGSEQLFELKAGKQYLVVAWEEDNTDNDLTCSPHLLTVIEAQTQTVTLSNP